MNATSTVVESSRSHEGLSLADIIFYFYYDDIQCFLTDYFWGRQKQIMNKQKVCLIKVKPQLPIYTYRSYVTQVLLSSILIKCFLTLDISFPFSTEVHSLATTETESL